MHDANIVASGTLRCCELAPPLGIPANQDRGRLLPGLEPRETRGTRLFSAQFILAATRYAVRKLNETPEQPLLRGVERSNCT